MKLGPEKKKHGIDVTLVDCKSFFEYTPALISVLYEPTDDQFQKHFKRITADYVTFLSSYGVNFVLGMVDDINEQTFFFPPSIQAPFTLIYFLQTRTACSNSEMFIVYALHNFKGWGNMLLYLKKEIWYQWLRTQSFNLRHTAFQSIITGLQITNAMANVNINVLKPATAITAPA